MKETFILGQEYEKSTSQASRARRWQIYDKREEREGQANKSEGDSCLVFLRMEISPGFRCHFCCSFLVLVMVLGESVI